jgi:hypothetical protein
LSSTTSIIPSVVDIIFLATGYETGGYANQAGCKMEKIIQSEGWHKILGRKKFKKLL